MLKACFFLFVFVGCVSPALAATYFISEGGTASNKSAAIGPCTKTSATMSMATHNSQSFSPGDTIIVCDTGGSFQSTNFIPPSSGSGKNRIIYQAAVGHTPIFEKRNHGVDLKNGQNSLKFVGLTFQNTSSRWVEIGYTKDRDPYRNDYIWFDQCIFYNSRTYSGILIETGDYGRITNCTFPDAPRANNCTTWDLACQTAWDAGDDMPNHCNCETAPADAIQGRLNMPGGRYWVFEGNTFGKFSHNAINSHGSIRHSVFRGNKSNNLFHGGMGGGHLYNEPGDRAYVLWEKNEIRNGGILKAKNPSYRDRMQINGVGLSLRGNYIIARYNESVGNDYGIMVMTYSRAYSDNNRVYHNTFLNNKLGIIHTSNSSREYNDNVLKNNIFSNDENFVDRKMVSQYNEPGWVLWWNVADIGTCINFFDNNLFWPSGTAGYYFKNTSTKNKTLAQLKTTYPTEWFSSNFEGSPRFLSTHNVSFNLQLNSNSSAIDAGAFLTKVTAIAGNIITVEDPNYFYDGWNIPDEVGDKIYRKGGGSAQILFINYDTRNITLDNANIFKIGDEITTVKFHGLAPDIGAKEYGVGVVDPIIGLSSPSNLIVLY